MEAEDKKEIKKEEKEYKEADIQDKKEESAEKTEESSNLSDKILIFAGIAVIIILLAIFIIPKFMTDNSNLTVEELHAKNIDGKLSENQGYMYNGIYSFVRFDNLWYTQVSTPSGKQLYNLPFHFGPKELEGVKINGDVNYSKLDNYKGFYVTFDPTDSNLNYIALSIGETDGVLINVFGKQVIAACTKNETTACSIRPIVNCNSTKAPVFLFDSSITEEGVRYQDNCIILSGDQAGLVKATDRMLYDMLHIMKR